MWVRIPPNPLMSGFYPYQDSLDVKEINKDTVVFEVEGSVAVKSGEYMNEKNGTLEFEVSRDRAEDMAKEILEG